MSDDQYSLKVYISDESLTALKEYGYRLCIAKEVNGKYNVVFQGVSKLLFQNTFQFEDYYRVFGTNKFADGALIDASTKKYPIMGGQKITLSSAGVFSPTSGSVNPEAGFTVHNQYIEPIHFGVDAFVGNEYSSIYVAEKPVLSGDVFLTPKKKFLVWFEQDLETDMMISRAITNSIRLDFTNASDITINYTAPKDAPAKGVWSYGPLVVLGQTYHPETNTFSLTPAILPTAELVQLTKLLQLEPPSQRGGHLAITNGGCSGQELNRWFRARLRAYRILYGIGQLVQVTSRFDRSLDK
ncbi:hypothetical protein E1B28_008312 [Marasmius oreades]|uniref:Uncharacterized protein n=1 Tax=Marasmius oreades TaxID=181124 RepID=A0A9P7RYA4_9AGAR|nr:uncharacterized protein E1B28_008312 [Marasmius oreades]KAG7091917.1 hypothetical protein E1B28_008312 [Marasmius oreades]